MYRQLVLVSIIVLQSTLGYSFDVATSTVGADRYIIRVEKTASGKIALLLCSQDNVTKCAAEPIGIYTSLQLESLSKEMTADEHSYPRLLYKFFFPRLLAGAAAGAVAGIIITGGTLSWIGAMAGTGIGLLDAAFDDSYLGQREALRDGLDKNNLLVFKGSTQQFFNLLRKYLPVNPDFLTERGRWWITRDQPNINLVNGAVFQ